MPKILIIIPTYNEIENIEDIINTIMPLDPAYEVLVVDDGSPDGTGFQIKQLITKYKNRLHLLARNQKNGIGQAYIAGFEWGLKRDYEYFFEMDADFSHDPHEIPKMVEILWKTPNDIVVGSRYITGVNVVNWPMSRVLLSYMASKYVRFITGLTIQDTTAGFVGYKRAVLESINLDKIKFTGYAFQIEMKFKSYKKGFQIVEHPIIFMDRQKGNSKLNKGIITEAIFGVFSMKLKSYFWKKNNF